jgi:hypothetical protein
MMGSIERREYLRKKRAEYHELRRAIKKFADGMKEKEVDSPPVIDAINGMKRAEKRLYKNMKIWWT